MRHVLAHNGGSEPNLVDHLARLVLCRAAGLAVVEFRSRFEIGAMPVGMRGPAWAARHALIEAGLADDADLQRWDAAFAEVDAWIERPQTTMAMFAAVARRPAARDPGWRAGEPTITSVPYDAAGSGSVPDAAPATAARPSSSDR